MGKIGGNGLNVFDFCAMLEILLFVSWINCMPQLIFLRALWAYKT